MTTLPVSQPPLQEQSNAFVRAARFPGLRALAWSGDRLYASRGSQLVCARIHDLAGSLTWQPVAAFRSAWMLRLSVRNRLIARIFRDGVHALAVLPSGGLVAAVAGAIFTLRANEREFRVTHTVTRRTRPFHITAVH